MLKDVIFQFFAVMSQDKIEFDENVCGKQREELEKCKRELLTAIGKDIELKQLFDKFVDANANLRGVILGKYYEEGFKCGVRLTLEFCGYELKEKK